MRMLLMKLALAPLCMPKRFIVATLGARMVGVKNELRYQGSKEKLPSKA